MLLTCEQKSKVFRMKLFRYFKISVVGISHDNVLLRFCNVLDHVVDDRLDIICIFIARAIMTLKIPVIEKASAINKGVELEASICRFTTYVDSVLVPT